VSVSGSSSTHNVALDGVGGSDRRYDGSDEGFAYGRKFDDGAVERTRVSRAVLPFGYVTDVSTPVSAKQYVPGWTAGAGVRTPDLTWKQVAAGTPPPAGTGVALVTT
jgi:hypothetical protein